MIVAIDGPAASGKSTVAQRVAASLGVAFLDTGAMYRAVTLEVQSRGLDPADEQACGTLAEELQIGFTPSGEILIDGQPGEPRIRGPKIDGDVSTVAAHPRVRHAIVAIQRSMGGRQSLVAEGRDTTTVVFPDADHKFFLVASPAERGRRRAVQEGFPERAARYAEDLARRDEMDSSRAHSPMRQAADATRVETDKLSADQVADVLLSWIRK